MKQKETYPLAIVKWRDACSSVIWEECKDIKEWSDDDMLVQECGWIIENNRRHLTICSQFTQDGSFGNKTKIPKSLLVEYTELEIK